MDKNQDKFPAAKVTTNMENNLNTRKMNSTKSYSTSNLYSYLFELANNPKIKKLSQTSKINKVNNEDFSKNSHPFNNDKINKNNKGKYLNYLFIL